MTTKITGDNIENLTGVTIADGGITWNAVTVADGSTQLTASAGNGYFLDTNTGVIEVFLPSSPTRGDTVHLADYGGNFATNNVLVNTGGQLIDSTATGGNAGIDYKLTTNNIVVQLVYVDANKGWLIQENEAKTDIAAADDTNAGFIAATGGTITTVDTNFKVHTFTGDGCFVVSNAGNAQGSNTVDYLVIAGGGSSSQGGAPTHSGAGGGAGGYRFSDGTASGCYSAGPSPLGASALPVSEQTYPITVGAGGARNPGCSHQPGLIGSNSVFSTITSAGGGAGRMSYPSVQTGTASPNGGSGGGGGAPWPSVGSTNTTVPGGTGNTPPVSPPQGNNGGATPTNNNSGGGGGGAGGVGGNATTDNGGSGGVGLDSSIDGTPTGRGGGGGGAGNTSGGPGTKGGGNGGVIPSTSGQAGTANTGGGAGGGASKTPPGSQTSYNAAGGKGLVIIRYKFQ